MELAGVRDGLGIPPVHFPARPAAASSIAAVRAEPANREDWGTCGQGGSRYVQEGRDHRHEHAGAAGDPDVRGARQDGEPGGDMGARSPGTPPASSRNIAAACSGVTVSLSPMISRMGTSIAERACGVISGSSVAWTLAATAGP